MEINNKIKTAHEMLSQCSLKFLEFVGKNPESLDRSNYSDLKWENELQPWPAFINGNMKNEFNDAAAKVMNLIRSVPRRLFDNDPAKVSSYLEIPLEKAEMALIKVSDKQLNNLLGRGDFIMTPRGELKCIEYNIGTNIGGWELPILQSMYRQHPIIAKFIEEYRIKINEENLISILLEHLIDTAVDSNLYRDEKINTAIIIPNCRPDAETLQKEKYFHQLYSTILKRKYGGTGPSGIGGEFFFCDYPHLRVSGESLYYNSKRVDIIMEGYSEYIPFNIYKVWANGGVNILNGPVTMIMANKLNVALLSRYEDSELFTPAERETIKKHIPWTRKMCDGETMDSYRGEKIRLKDFVIANREKLILKPSDRARGDGMCPGKHMSAEDWEEAVRIAFKERAWVAQECVESASFLYQYGKKDYAPHYAVLGIFMAGQNYAGVYTRVHRDSTHKGVVSTHFGSQETVLFLVDE